MATIKYKITLVPRLSRLPMTTSICVFSQIDTNLGSKYSGSHSFNLISRYLRFAYVCQRASAC